jgi:polyhydroxyalkanoate synthesis regulator phasin
MIPCFQKKSQVVKQYTRELSWYAEKQNFSPVGGEEMDEMMEKYGDIRIKEEHVAFIFQRLVEDGKMEAGWSERNQDSLARMACIKSLQEQIASLRRQLTEYEQAEAKEWRSGKSVEKETGTFYRCIDLLEASVKEGYDVRRTFDQDYDEVALYHIDVWNKVYGLNL